MGNANGDGPDGEPPARRASTEYDGGSTTLVLHPGDGTDERCVPSHLPSDPAETNLLVVSYTETVAEVIRQWQGVESQPPSFGLISFAEFDRSAAADASPSKRSLPGQNLTVTTMSDVSDLQGLGTAVTLYLDDWAENDRETVVCVDSLGPMLDGNGTQPTFQFLHVLTGCVRRAGASLYVHLGEERDDRTVDTLRPLFDDVTERGSDAPGVDAETVWDLLGNPRRQYVLYYLCNERETETVNRLAVRLARWENDAAERELTSAECDRAYTALASVHLPRLAEADVVDYDTDEKRVSLSAAARRADDLERYVELSFDGEFT
ncbi:MAG: hypothetical protein ABEJ82_07715 [Haloplanus sp.]